MNLHFLFHHFQNHNHLDLIFVFAFVMVVSIVLLVKVAILLSYGWPILDEILEILVELLVLDLFMVKNVAFEGFLAPFLVTPRSFTGIFNQTFELHLGS